MNRVGALLAMTSGLVVSAYYIAVNHPWVQIRLHLHASETLWLGLDPVCAGVFGVPVGVLLVFRVASWRVTLKN